MKVKIRDIVRKADELDARWRYTETNDPEYRSSLLKAHDDYLEQEVEIDDPFHHPEKK